MLREMYIQNKYVVHTNCILSLTTSVSIKNKRYYNYFGYFNGNALVFLDHTTHAVKTLRTYKNKQTNKQTNL